MRTIKMVVLTAAMAGFLTHGSWAQTIMPSDNGEMADHQAADDDYGNQDTPPSYGSEDDLVNADASEVQENVAANDQEQ